MIALNSAFLGFALVNGITYAVLASKYFNSNKQYNYNSNYNYHSNFNSNYNTFYNYAYNNLYNNNDSVLVAFCSVRILKAKRINKTRIFV